MNKTKEIPDRSQAWVLVVEDDDTARRSLTEILRLEGYQVDQTANATQAVEILRKKIFDAILLDLRMPIDNSPQSPGITEEQAGLIVLRYVAEEAPETPVIFLTAHGSMETAIEALRYNAEDYLLKPAAPGQILAALDKALWHRQENIRQQSQATAIEIAKSIAVELSLTIDKLETSLQALRDTSAISIEKSPRGQKFSQPEPTMGSVHEARIATTINPPPVKNLDEGITIDLERREIRQKFKSPHGMETSIRRLSLTPTEGKLVQIFIENSGKVFSHRELITLVQGYEITDQEAPELLRPLISRLRHKLESFPNGRNWIRSIRGIGYVFEIETEQSAKSHSGVH